MRSASEGSLKTKVKGCQTRADSESEVAEFYSIHRPARGGQTVHPLADAAESLRTMIYGVGSGHDGPQYLGRTDVRGSLFPDGYAAPGVLQEAMRRRAL